MSKICDLEIVNDKCYYRLIGSSNSELMDIINFKSWEFKSWKYGREKKYFTFIHFNRSENEKIVWSYLGFSPILIRYLQSLGYIINGKEMYRAKEIIIGKPYFGLWKHQQEAIDAWTSNGCYGVIKAPTGSGKTTLICHIIWKMRLRTIVCVHTSDLLINVWYNELIKQFGEGIKNRIGIVGGGLTKKNRIEMRLSGDVSYDYNIKKDIIIASTQTLLNHLDVLSKERFGLVVADEIHRYPAEHFKKVMNVIRAPYRIGASATLVRPDGMTPLIHGLIGDIVYRVSIRELVNRGILVEPIFNTIIVNDDMVQSDIVSCGLSKLEYSRYLKKKSASSIVKKNYVIELCINLTRNNKKFILYTDFVNKSEDNDDGGSVFTRDDYVKELLENGVKVVGVSSEFSSEEREKVFEMLKTGKIDGLIFGKLGAEGVNIPNIDSVVMANVTKSTILFPQRTGRSMRITNDGKRNAFIYEICLNLDKELEWSKINFFEYLSEGYEKKYINIK